MIPAVDTEPTTTTSSTQEPRISALLQWADAMIEHIDHVLATCELKETD